MPNQKQEPISHAPIPYGKQHITDEDIAAVERVLRSDYLTQGPEIEKFETAFAEYVGSKYAVAVANGTAALHLCALALDVKPGQKVITTPITFAASANCVRYCGGEVVFADINPDTYTLDIDAVRALLEAAAKGTYAGIIPVDFAGRAVNLEAFRKLADEFDCWIIEDACHAPGGHFVDSAGKEQKCGNGAFADLAIFSFHPVKHIAAGEGGMITTNDAALYRKLQVLRTHGIVKVVNDGKVNGERRNGERMGSEEPTYRNSIELAGGEDSYPGWYMEMQELGYNYRLTDFQAALGKSQLQRADKGLKRRREIAARYAEAFERVEAIRDVNSEVNGGSENGKRFTVDRSTVHDNTVHGSPQDTVHDNTVHRSPSDRSPQPPIHRSAVHRSPTAGHAYHLYVIEADNRLALYNHLREHQIFAQIHYIPLHLMPYYREQGWKPGDFPNAEHYYSRCISLPMFPTLTEEEQEFVIKTIKGFIQLRNHE